MASGTVIPAGRFAVLCDRTGPGGTGSPLDKAKPHTWKAGAGDHLHASIGAASDGSRVPATGHSGTQKLVRAMDRMAVPRVSHLLLVGGGAGVYRGGIPARVSDNEDGI